MLQRIAACAALVGVLAVYARPRVQVGVLVTLLVGYTVLLLGIGDLAPWTNPASRLDTTLFAPWIYQWHADTGLGHDPEGLLSTLGALASTVLGLIAGGCCATVVRRHWLAWVWQPPCWGCCWPRCCR